MARIKLNVVLFTFMNYYTAVKLVHQLQNLRNQNSSTTSMMIKYLTPSGKGYSNEMYCWGKYPILEKLKICYRKTFLSDKFFEMAM